MNHTKTVSKYLSTGGLCVILACLPEMASAHLVSTRFGELYSGILHPLTALVHIVPWLAMGLLAGLQTLTTARSVILYFPLAVFAGTLMANWIPALELISVINILSFVVLGILVALSQSLRASGFIGLSIAVGVSHGYANGYGNVISDLSGYQYFLYILGITITAYLTVTLVAGSAYMLAQHRHWSRIAIRAIGSWIAAAGIIFASFSLIN